MLVQVETFIASCSEGILAGRVISMRPAWTST